VAGCPFLHWNPDDRSAQEGCRVVTKCTAVLHFLTALRGLRLALLAVWRDPETKALPVVVGVLLVSGTLFYRAAEDWSSFSPSISRS
jgi:hypothetical protein